MKKVLFMMLLSLLGTNLHLSAQGDLLITPKRVVFEGNRQKEDLNLVNLGKDTTTYSISFVQRRMLEDGSFVMIEKPDSGQMFADKYLRVFPRKVTLAPGEPQVIMLQFRRSGDMPDGEYRSHLYFRSEKNYTPLGAEGSDRDTSSLSVRLIPIFGMSIPVIIRIGETNVSNTITDLELIKKDTIQYLQFKINRTGNISSYGSILADFIPAHGKPFSIGVQTGIAVYTNINSRQVSLRINVPAGVKLQKGNIRVQYTSPEESNYLIYAEQVLELSN